DEGARSRSYQMVFLKRRGLNFRCDWRHVASRGEFDLDEEPLDPRVVNASCDTALNGQERSFGAGTSCPGDLWCIDTGESQFWTAGDLIEACDAFSDVWESKDERVSADAFMHDLSTLGISSDDEDIYAWFARDKYDGHRFRCGYTTPDRSRLELEFIDTSDGRVQVRLWRERGDEEPVYAALRTPRELFERLRGMFQ